MPIVPPIPPPDGGPATSGGGTTNVAASTRNSIPLQEFRVQPVAVARAQRCEGFNVPPGSFIEVGADAGNATVIYIAKSKEAAENGPRTAFTNVTGFRVWPGVRNTGEFWIKVGTLGDAGIIRVSEAGR